MILWEKIYIFVIFNVANMVGALARGGWEFPLIS